MKRRTLLIMGLGLPATLVTVAVVAAQPDHSPTITHSSQTNANDVGTATVQTPSVTINGQAVPVKPNSTTNFNDGTTRASVKSSQTTSSGQNSSATSVNVSQSNNGHGTSSSDVTVSGNDSVTITSNSSIEASGGNVTMVSH